MDKFIKKAKILGKDKRGWAVDPILEEFFPKRNIKNVHLVSIEPGQIRGNHYHQKQTEFNCILNGKVKLVLQNKKTGKRMEKTINCIKPTMYINKPNMIHAIKNIGKAAVYLFICTDKKYNPKKHDVVKLEEKILDF